MADYAALPIPRSLADSLRTKQAFKALSASDFYTLTRFVERAYAAGYSDGNVAGFQEGLDYRERQIAEETDR